MHHIGQIIRQKVCIIIIIVVGCYCMKCVDCWNRKFVRIEIWMRNDMGRPRISRMNHHDGCSLSALLVLACDNMINISRTSTYLMICKCSGSAPFVERGTAMWFASQMAHCARTKSRPLKYKTRWNPKEFWTCKMNVIYLFHDDDNDRMI